MSTSPSKHLIAGTAGHIDHGKTSLVQALTGVDTDRLKEEKERGITIDLGFASSLLSNNITLSWIDVPGHERFIGNMLAGVAGIDFVVLVVAANEGVMPQTREHFEICRMLGIRHGIVAITKADLVDEEGIELAMADAEALIAGSFLASADLIPVSCRTGLGIERLRRSIEALSARIGARAAVGSFRLPVDRSFVMKGFGTVVTGTVFNGLVQRDAEVEILPSGIRSRIRGIQVHGRENPAAQRGQRAAINLAGIESADIQRGNTLAAPGAFSVSRSFDIEVEFLEDALALPNFSPVHLHLATQSTTARIRFHGDQREARGGSRVFARIATDNGIVAMPGDRFILRRFSPVVTIAGGAILDNAPPRLRRREAGTTAANRLQSISSGGPEAALIAYCRETELGHALQSLIPRMGMTSEEIQALAHAAGLRILGSGPDWIVGKEQLEALAEKAQSLLATFHRENPILPGMPLESFRAGLAKSVPDALFQWLLTQDSRFRTERAIIRLTIHQPSLNREEMEASDRIESTFLQSGLQVPPIAEVLSACGVDPQRGNTLLRALIREGKLVKVGQDLIFHKQALGKTVSLLQQHRGKSFSVPEFKEWTGVSRKYAIPLLEFFDRQRVTRREGDLRTVL